MEGYAEKNFMRGSSYKIVSWMCGEKGAPTGVVWKGVLKKFFMRGSFL